MDIGTAIVAEVREQIAARGWSMQQAREAFGLSHPAFYRYFEGETGVGLSSMPWTDFCSVGAALGYSPTEFARALEQRAVGLNA